MTHTSPLLSSKKILLRTLVGLGILLPTLAEASPRSGVTVAGALGWGVGEFKTKQQLVDPGATGGDTFSQSNLAPSSLLWQLAIGYDWGFARCWVLGFDFYAGLSNLSVRQVTGQSDPNNATTFKMLNSFGLRMRPGGMIGPRTMLHLTFGVDWSRFYMRASGGQFPDGTAPVSPGSLSSRKAGFIYGCGILTQVGHWRKSSLSVGLEFLRTTYKTLPTLVQPLTDNSASVNQTVKPFINAIMARLVYKF